ncbi:LLM class flavin-dependent oxidoreductase [Kineococcus sp. NPDC059986]|uniref:LLM class flavin-dependent oxidoreductase n=1 Tax=Kineococcus sp. NPDC059986 TaxID=3155538 RepID=UPI00344F8A6F
MALHGISLLPDCAPQERSASEYYRDVLTLARQADAWGMSHVKMTEHYLHPYGGYCPSPLTFLTAVAARTTSIRLMTGAAIPAFHHPVQLAATAAMVDVLSGGRLDLGLGRAWLPYEFETFGVPMGESRARYVATVEAVRRLWTGRPVSEDTPFFSYTDAVSHPSPVQDPPPLWGAAVRSPESFEWLARNDIGLMMSVPPLARDYPLTRQMVALYRAEHARVHGGATAPRVALSLPLYVGRDDRSAFAQATGHHRRYLDVWRSAISSWSQEACADYPGYEQMAEHARTMGDVDLRTDGTAVVGGPGRVAERIEELHRDLDVDVFLWQVDFGGQDLASMTGSLGRLVDDVLPRLTQPGPAVAPVADLAPDRTPVPA